jgi:hypothetical protein
VDLVLEPGVPDDQRFLDCPSLTRSPADEAERAALATMLTTC